jgi:hypothetical protein
VLFLCDWISVRAICLLSDHADISVKDSAAGGRRPYEALGRQGAVRKRKGDVYEMNGHQFVQRQFYQPIMCALCQEFLLTGEGYQCEDCRYACHKKCYPKVVTKCISKTTADGVSHSSNSVVGPANVSRKGTKKRSIIESLIVSAHTPTCRPIGVAIVVTCCLSVERIRSSARNVQSHVIKPVRIWFPISVV